MDDRLRLVVVGSIGVDEEENADRQAVLRFQRARLIELEALGFLAKKAVRELAEQAGAVAGGAADAAAVLHVLEGQERLLDDFVRGLTVARGHAADAAGVAADG